jgi:hypothetical protein
MKRFHRLAKALVPHIEILIERAERSIRIQRLIEAHERLAPFFDRGVHVATNPCEHSGSTTAGFGRGRRTNGKPAEVRLDLIP